MMGEFDNREDVLEPPTAKRRREAAELYFAEFRKRLVGFELPEAWETQLEAGIESREKCRACSGQVRAVVENVEKGESFLSDLEVKVYLYCPGAECRWSATQWRPWRKGKPLDL